MSLSVHSQGWCGLNCTAGTQGESTGTLLAARPNMGQEERKGEAWGLSRTKKKKKWSQSLYYTDTKCFTEF